MEEAIGNMPSSPAPEILQDPSAGERIATPPPSPLVLMPGIGEPVPSPTTGLVAWEQAAQSTEYQSTPITSEKDMDLPEDDDDDNDEDDWWGDETPPLDQGKHSHLSAEDLAEIAAQPVSSTEQAAPDSAIGMISLIIFSWQFTFRFTFSFLGFLRYGCNPWG